LEPPAVLVGAFEVKVGREFQPVTSGLQDGVPTAAGLEPDVEDVLFLPQVRPIKARRVDEVAAE
jgi:hypothetical protein